MGVHGPIVSSTKIAAVFGAWKKITAAVVTCHLSSYDGTYRFEQFPSESAFQKDLMTNYIPQSTELSDLMSGILATIW